MNEQTLIRLAMILQDKAPSTLNKYICRLAEGVLLESAGGLSLTQLSLFINEQFSLSFSPEEIEYAIKKRGNGRISFRNSRYFINEQTRVSLDSAVTFAERLEEYICTFVESHPTEYTVKDITNLLTRYFYSCFNSNVQNLLSLFNKEVIKESNDGFSATNQEISLINDFISWDNSEKDKFIYSIISVCYEYCMLTIKKDNILSRELFQGKRFYLDANIIFRMAGVNNAERKFITQDFIHRCNDVGIELYYTSCTLQEIFRVIEAQVAYIKGICGHSTPLSPESLDSLTQYDGINDFYKLYYEWCQIQGNCCGDFLSFREYLFDLAKHAIKELKIKESTPYKTGTRAADFKESAKILLEYKNSKRTWRSTSVSSAETDITNVFDVIDWRKKTGTSIWQTNDFIVSADHMLIDWAANNYSGIPIVVLPSVWLSIILRFSGRTEDDYKSFCLFLTQRQHIDIEGIINPSVLIKDINSKTDDIDIKNQIVWEIAENRTEYSFLTQEEYGVSVDRAFDKILRELHGKADEEIQSIREKMREKVDELEAHSETAVALRTAKNVAIQRQKTIERLAHEQTNKKIAFFEKASNYAWIFYLGGGVILVLGLCIWLFEWQPMYSWIICKLPDKLVESADSFINAYTVFCTAVGLMVAATGKLISYLGSDKRRDIVYNKYFHYYSSLLKDEDTE